MTKPAALTGDYTDLRFVKGRKVCIMCIEFPIEAGKQIVEAFGTPLPGTGVPVAIARLQEPTKHDEAEPRAKQRFDELRLSAQSALRCKEPEFHQFLEDHAARCGYPHMRIDSDALAANYLRDTCEISSRSELDKPGLPAERWRVIRDQFEAWRIAKGHGIAA